MKNFLSSALMLIYFSSIALAQNQLNQISELNDKLISGWNTFDNRNIMSQVFLPDGLSLHFKLNNPRTKELLSFAFTGNTVPGSEKVRVLAHTPDGSYTDFILNWQDIAVRFQTAGEGSDISVLITNLNRNHPPELVLEPEYIYDSKGEVSFIESTIRVVGPNDFKFSLFTEEDSKQTSENKFDLKTEFAVSTNQSSLSEVRSHINKQKRVYQNHLHEFGKVSDVYGVIQNSINWTVVYDSSMNRLVTPVSRPWTYGWGGRKPGGFVLFCWDNFFAAYMHSLESRELAFNEAIQMMYEIDDVGFVPNYSGPNGVKSRDRSQPPVGSLMVKEIYRKYPEKWFLEFAFDRLLKWNRWWKDNRDYKGYLCWGSNPFDDAFDKKMKEQYVFKAASNESGLDNTPMYDGVIFNKKTNMLFMGDVGLMSLYIADCNALIEMAKILKREKEEQELIQRAEYYSNNLKKLWDDDFGLFLNIHTDDGKLSRRISPTNFYPLLAKVASQEQAERMINEHFYNPKEFWGEYVLPSISRNDTAYTGRNYWRGSIWAPMNFLVYLGLRNYDLPQARKDLSNKSRELLMENWESMGYVRENYHAETGGDPGFRSEHFYNWGALLGIVCLLEEGFVLPTENSIE